MLKPITVYPDQAAMDRLADFAHEGLLPIVEATFEDGRKCHDCPHKRAWTEGHGERLRDCALLAYGGHLSDCPGVED